MPRRNFLRPLVCLIARLLNQCLDLVEGMLLRVAASNNFITLCEMAINARLRLKRNCEYLKNKNCIILLLYG